MSAQCLMNNCRNSAPAGEAFCAQHRSDIKMPDPRTPAPASADAMEVVEALVKARLIPNSADAMEVARKADAASHAHGTQAAARIIQQYGDQREAAGFRCGVEAAAPVMQSLRRAVELYTCHPCALCGGDCSSANPPVLSCPTQGALEAFRKHDQLLALLETQEAG